MKQLLISFGIIFLITSCIKHKHEDVDIFWNSIEQINDEIICRFQVQVDEMPRSNVDAGIYWGTSATPAVDGVKVPSSNGEQVVINEFKNSTDYYFQAYCNYDGETYLTNVMSLSIGKGWKMLANQPPLECRKVAISPNGNVHVVGENGIHFYSDDLGETWNAITHTNSDYLAHLKFISNDVAYLGAGVNFRKSVDGGMTWLNITNPYNGYNGLYFLDANTFFVSKDDSVFKTTNSGNTFTAAYTPSIGGYKSFFFVNATTGYGLSSEGHVIKTSNGGASWSVQNPTAIYGYCDEIWFFDEYTGLVTTSEYVYRTSDGGVTWLNVADLNDQGFTMDFCDATNGAIGGSWGLLVDTQNAGLNWQTNYFPEENDHILSLDLLNDTLGFAIDDAGNVIIYE